MITRKESSCTCSICENMCRRSPCFPTPEDTEKLISAGLKDKLYPSIYFDVKLNILMPLIAPLETSKGCIFFNSKRRCDLHDRKLKPTEGRLAYHNLADDGLRRSVAFTWVSPKGIEVMKMFSKTEDLVHALELLLKYKK